MTRGSHVHDDVSRHFDSCRQCRAVDPETIRVRQLHAFRRTVPDRTLAALCPAGRTIYQAYLWWLAEPDE